MSSLLKEKTKFVGASLFFDAGSVFLEAMISLMIIAAVLAVSYRTVGEQMLRENAARDKQRAALVAQSQLAAAGVDTPLEVGESSGVDGDYTWRVEVQPQDSGASAFGRLLDVSVFVRRIKAKQDLVVLRKLQLAPPTAYDASAG